MSIPAAGAPPDPLFGLVPRPDRAAVLLGNTPRATPILEIGPSYNPLAPRRDGWATTIVDHAPTAELRAKYAAMGVDTSPIEEVDHVWAGGPLHAAIPDHLHGRFGRLLASHVLEHLPDPVGFLASAARLLAPDGVLALAIPDRRYCFDYFKPPTTTADLVAAIGAVRHSRKTLYQQNAYSVAANTALAFGQMPIAATEFLVPLETAWLALATWSDAPASPYVDAHAWHFTPAWFRLALLELAEGGHADWQAIEVTPTIHCEFIALLRRGRPAWPGPAAREQARRALLLEAMRETQAQIDHAVAGGLLPPPPSPLPPASPPPASSLASCAAASPTPAAPPPPGPRAPNLRGLHPLARAVQRLLSGGGNRWFGPPA